jgi:hypothetical protein
VVLEDVNSADVEWIPFVEHYISWYKEYNEFTHFLLVADLSLKM